MKQYPFAAARVFNTPLLLHPAKAQTISDVLLTRMFGQGSIVTELDSTTVKPMAWWDDDDDVPARDEGEPDKGFDLVDGLAVVTVEGTLVHRHWSLRPYSGMLGYNAIATAFQAAMRDPAVRMIAFDCNSPGGEVSGCFDLVDLIYQSRGEKPLIAVLDDAAYSACYAIASACDRIVVPRTGGAGSVGVVSVHIDWSAALKNAGGKATVFQYGARKADGSPLVPLPREAADRFQADVDTLGELFVETVARNRALSTAKVRATEAGTYMGAAGVDVGLVDAVMAPADCYRTLLAEMG